MPEAITKYAINSTLGTENFRSLDLILRDEIAKQSQIIASDDVFLEYNDLRLDVPKYETADAYHPLVLKASHNGSIKIKGRTTLSYANVNIKIYKNTEVVYERPSGEGNFSTEIIVFKPNDIIKIYANAWSVSSRDGFVSITDLCVYGTVKQTVFELIEEV